MAIKVKNKKNVVPLLRRRRSSTSKISSKNQISIPVQILDQIKLSTGDIVKFSINAAGNIELEPIKQKSNLEEILDSLTKIGETYPAGFNLRDHRKAAWGE